MKSLKWIFLFPVFLTATALAGGYDLAYYRAFDHHPAADQELFKKIHAAATANQDEVDPFEENTIKTIVTAAYHSTCYKIEEKMARQSCEDLVRVMIFPNETPTTDFGRKIYTIFIEGNFKSSEGAAIALALCIDPASLKVTATFDEMKSGEHNRSLLPWFRFYATYPEPLDFSLFLFELLPQNMARQLNREIETSWQLMGLAYHYLAQGKVSYPEYFKAYRRHFQAIHAREAINNTLGQIAKEKKERGELALYNRSLFGITQEYSAAVQKQYFESTAWVRDWLNAPYEVLTFYKNYKDGNSEIGDRELETLARFKANESNNLLANWHETLEGSLALVILYEEGFEHLGLSKTDIEHYQQEAQKIRKLHKWENKNLLELRELILH